MPKRIYPPEMETFLREKFKTHTARQLVPIVKEKFDIEMTPEQMKAYISNHKIRGGKKGKAMPEKRITTPEIDNFIREHHKGTGYQAMADMVNERFGTSYTADQMDSYYGRNKLNSGLTGQFEKGRVPANKGTHPPTVGRMAETQFKKGQMPKNHLPVGSVRVRRSYKGKKPYVWEKVAEPNKWRMKHVLEWERHNGPVPKDKIVVFADGDTLNTDISNLLLVSRSQHAVMNRWGIKGCDKEHAETAANIASLKIQISKAKRAKKGEK